jgi:SAM-dependent methyltransferase
MPWSDAADWWLGEIDADPAYEAVVTPILLELLAPRRDSLYLDLGCGEGRVMRRILADGVRVHGVDLNLELASRTGAPSLVAKLPGLPLRDDSYDGVFAVLVVEHLVDHGDFFAEAARVTRPDGVMVLVSNHPIWTSPGSTPITDDEETLWRPGEYFSEGVTELAVGETSITFHHRTVAGLLNAAAVTGWALERVIEVPHHELAGQAGIARLLGCRWRLLP